jgi:hypothetical protein
LLLFVIVRLQGHVSGQEFSPTHFRVRKFSFYEIPLLHLQITPIKRSDVTPRSATYLRQKTLIRAPKGIPTTWHLVSISRGLTGSTPADADLLVEQLTIGLDRGDFWRQWSIDHPQRANILWPLIQRLAERELYVLMPRLMEMSQTDQPAAQFSQQADQWLQQQYVSLVNDMRAAERDQLADQLLEEALSDFPESAELSKLKRPGSPDNTGSSKHPASSENP